MKEVLLVGEREAAALCGLGRTSWRKHARIGRLPAPVRLGRRVLWSREELIEWTRAGCPPRDRWEALQKEGGHS